MNFQCLSTILKLCLFCLALCEVYGSSNLEIRKIQYQQNDIEINGSLDEWDMSDVQMFYILSEQNVLIDSARVAMTWDENFLYVAFQSYDHNLMKEEKGLQNTYIWRNDGMEIYIDPKNDSDSSMNMNDYNLIMDLAGDYTIYTVTQDKIDHPLIVVPKGNNGVEYFIDAATQLYGTLNDTSDIDQGYVIELKIPWAPMGILPQTQDTIKIDICSNNLNQFSQPSDWRTYIRVPERFYATNWNGLLDFGHPQDWNRVVLLGSMSPIKKIVISNYRKLLAAGLLLITLLGIGIWYYRRETKELAAIINKSSIVNQRLIDQLQIVDQEQGQLAPSNISKNPALSQMHDMLQIHIDKVAKPSDLARLMNISIRQLQRICKEDLDTTPSSYISMYKMERAAHDLKTSTKSIKEIAYQLGYTDPNYFSKVFKKYFEMTPTQYQESSQSDMGG